MAVGCGLLGAWLLYHTALRQLQRTAGDWHGMHGVLRHTCFGHSVCAHASCAVMWIDRRSYSLAGYKARGNAELLQREGERLGLLVTVLELRGTGDAVASLVAPRCVPSDNGAHDSAAARVATQVAAGSVESAVRGSPAQTSSPAQARQAEPTQPLHNDASLGPSQRAPLVAESSPSSAASAVKPPLPAELQTVSSSAVRRLVARGAVADAWRFLGRWYCVVAPASAVRVSNGDSAPAAAVRVSASDPPEAATGTRAAVPATTAAAPDVRQGAASTPVDMEPRLGGAGGRAEPAEGSSPAAPNAHAVRSTDDAQLSDSMQHVQMHRVRSHSYDQAGIGGLHEQNPVALTFREQDACNQVPAEGVYMAQVYGVMSAAGNADGASATLYVAAGECVALVQSYVWVNSDRVRLDLLARQSDPL